MTEVNEKSTKEEIVTSAMEYIDSLPTKEDTRNSLIAVGVVAFILGYIS